VFSGPLRNGDHEIYANCAVHPQKENWMRQLWETTTDSLTIPGKGLYSKASGPGMLLTPPALGQVPEFCDSGYRPGGMASSSGAILFRR
jgi:hypothetical protein